MGPDQNTPVPASSAGRDGRYSRQVRFAPFGAAGQQGLARSCVLVVGMGALGTGIAETLARCGVGRLILVDRDYVEWSNLQRQQLYTEEDARVRTPKAVAARTRLMAVNSEIVIEAHVLDVRAEELESLLPGVDLIMDGTDNFDTRLIINDLAQKHGIPWIYGACVGSYGITYTILPGETPCLNCLLGTIPLGGDTCDTAGILPQAVQMVTTNGTAEALKLLGGFKDKLRGKLLTFDIWRNEQQEIGVQMAKRRTVPHAVNHGAIRICQPLTQSAATCCAAGIRCRSVRHTAEALIWRRRPPACPGSAAARWRAIRIWFLLQKSRTGWLCSQTGEP